MVVVKEWRGIGKGAWRNGSSEGVGGNRERSVNVEEWK